MPAVLATSLPGVSDVALDGRVVAFTFAVSVVTALIFSLAPLTAERRATSTTCCVRARAARAAVFGNIACRQALVFSSVAFAFVLLVGAGLLIRSLNNLLAVDTRRASRERDEHAGRRCRRPAIVSAAASARSIATCTTVCARCRACAPPRFPATFRSNPMANGGPSRPIARATPAASPPSVAVTWTHGQYFETFGIPIVRGRAFSPEEEAEARPVAIVSRGLAARFWPGEDAVGKRVKWGIAPRPRPG